MKKGFIQIKKQNEKKRFSQKLRANLALRKQFAQQIVSAKDSTTDLIVRDRQIGKSELLLISNPLEDNKTT